ncbi:MAG: hypothetical protein QCI38_08485 [Candidatus Thermoplasmatota archaeon]|nr:hypothetical protein [Candidatus Thermoplasmatota archaeon]
MMHGFLWTLHQDHHFPKKRGLQRNDAFALFFSGLSFFFIYTGIADGLDFKLYIGIGVTLYGVGYFTFHDIMFHRRVRRLKYKPKSRYMKRIFKAHSTHHQKSGAPHTGVSFGFLFASKKYDV